MNATQRKQYLILNDIEDYLPKGIGCPCLCTWCKYCEWEGSSCCESYPVCNHPLDVVKEKEEADCPTWQGCDCWGFRPMYKQEDCVDVVGLWLQGKHVSWESIE
jgi:hypothetical protein